MAPYYFLKSGGGKFQPQKMPGDILEKNEIKVMHMKNNNLGIKYCWWIKCFGSYYDNSDVSNWPKINIQSNLFRKWVRWNLKKCFNGNDIGGHGATVVFKINWIKCTLTAILKRHCSHSNRYNTLSISSVWCPKTDTFWGWNFNCIFLLFYKL